MTRDDIETILDKLPYDIIVFDGVTFPNEIYCSFRDPFVRYAKKELSAPRFNFSRGWLATDYDYHACEHLFTVLFIKYDDLILPKKIRLLNAIKNFK